jgi:NAD(P)-dependent dehydrogenase (short-subunit alcohol dehydrogenase family)
MDNSLAGKVAVISGSDSGIGAQIARELSELGATVVINYPYSDQILVDHAAAVVSSLKSPGIAVEADISTTTGPQVLIDAAVAAYGKIDILVNSKLIPKWSPLYYSEVRLAAPFLSEVRTQMPR